MRGATLAVAVALAAAVPAAAQERSELSLGQAADAGQGGPGAEAGRVVVIDLDLVLERSRRGRALLAQLDAEGNALIEENQTIEARLRDEERALTERRPEMDPAAFRAEADAFDARVQEIRDAQATKRRELLERRESLQAGFLDDALPVLAAILQERGATVVMDRESVILFADGADVTDEAIARLDAATEPGEAGPSEAPAMSAGGGLSPAGEASDPASGAAGEVGAPPPEE